MLQRIFICINITIRFVKFFYNYIILLQKRKREQWSHSNANNSHFVETNRDYCLPVKRSTERTSLKKKKTKKSTSNSSTILSTKNPNKRRSEVASGRHQSVFLFSSPTSPPPFNEADANRFRLTGLDPRRRFIYPLATFLSWITVKNERQRERETRILEDFILRRG